MKHFDRYLARGESHNPVWPLFLPTLALALVSGIVLVLALLKNDLERLQSQEIAAIAKTRENALKAFDMARAIVKATPCTEEFAAQLSEVAFLPDGLNEFLFVPEGKILCGSTVHLYEDPVELAEPDATEPDDGLAYWLEKDLSFLRRPGVRGMVIRQGDFAVTVAPPGLSPITSPWLSAELIAIDRSGMKSLSGASGLYNGMNIAEATGQQTPNLQSVACAPGLIFCIAAKASLWIWLEEHLFVVFVSVAALTLVAWLGAVQLTAWLAQYLSFEARFLRTLSPDTLEVAYQPIMEIQSGRIVGCEALARYRDVDGTRVSPDNFIDLVVLSGRTVEFSKMVVERAYRDLSTSIPASWHLQVNFNIFPRDLDSPDLLGIFKPFLDARDPRFVVAAEIVEVEELNLAVANNAFRTLASAGIKSFIDDCGAGYSSIENVATLPVDGVKLDRSFAMAPPDSVMGRMFVQVLKLIQTSGRPLVVEGVESHAQLEMLRRTGLAQYAQGYCIAKPLSVEELTERLLPFHVRYEHIEEIEDPSGPASSQGRGRHHAGGVSPTRSQI